MATMKMSDNLTPYLEAEEQQENELLSLMLASSIHEVKNNFGRLVFAINNALEELPQETSTNLQDKVNSEIRYISNQLSQILILYKDHQSGYTPNIEEISVGQLLRETRSRHVHSHTNLQIGTECDEDLIAFLDDKFVVNMLDTLIYNAQAAGATHILMSAQQSENAVMIKIEDDGPGIPESVINRSNSGHQMLGENDIENNSFGLGLFFAKKILALHTNDSHTGSCVVSNGGRLGGAVISLYFP